MVPPKPLRLSRIPHKRYLQLERQFEPLLAAADADPTSCVPWPGQIGNRPYGRLWVNNRQVQAHRVAFELYHGRSVRSDKVLRHTCHTPACVNPHHLKEGTDKQNVRDSIRVGRHSGWTEASRVRLSMQRKPRFEPAPKRAVK